MRGTAVSWISARTALFGGDQSTLVSRVHGRIIDCATARRERENEGFALNPFRDKLIEIFSTLRSIEEIYEG